MAGNQRKISHLSYKSNYCTYQRHCRSSRRTSLTNRDTHGSPRITGVTINHHRQNRSYVRHFLSAYLSPYVHIRLRLCAPIVKYIQTFIHPARVKSKKDYVSVPHFCWMISHVSDSPKVWWTNERQQHGAKWFWARCSSQLQLSCTRTHTTMLEDVLTCILHL